MYKWEEILKEIVDDEFRLSNFHDNASASKNFYVLKNQWAKLNSFEKYFNWLSERVKLIKPKIFDYSKNKEDESETLFQVVTIRIKDLIQTIILFKWNNSKALSLKTKRWFNEFGVDLTIRNTFKQIAEEYILDCLAFLKENNLDYNLGEYYNRINKALKKALSKRLTLDIIDKTYAVFETISDVLNEIDENGFHALKQDEEKINSYILELVSYESKFYFLILIYETLEFHDMKNIGIDDSQNKLYYCERKDNVEMTKIINN